MRRLTLKKETLAELGSDDLRAVVGGASAGPTCVPDICDTTVLRVPPTERVCPPTLPSFDVICH